MERGVKPGEGVAWKMTLLAALCFGVWAVVEWFEPTPPSSRGRGSLIPRLAHSIFGEHGFAIALLSLSLIALYAALTMRRALRGRTEPRDSARR